ncbi:bifunctional riboflavin kinase/FAD synthetase [Bacteroidales bacterium OttesenSCG-928-K03]|nr:bifunctional riboflavin kinase/FAD synthetase [Odoribacter sp. OttesenSCG-928-L07]MDL2242202.1 bifunctional riboflavin kinase/FAD synthetase [Bacteroidales bacterium OttesenSCG-928-K03]
MRYYSDITEFPKIDNAIVAVGNFDGVHLGHKAVIEKMKQIKEKNGGNIVIVTFHPHPRSVLSDKNVKFIHSQSRKAHLLAKLGVDYLMDINFTKEFSKLSAYQFIENYLVKYINAKNIVVGYDCHFGPDHNKTMEALNELKKKYHYEITNIPPVYCDGKIVSSTQIRNALERGDIKEANLMLGYEYSVYGRVVYGQQIGRTIGFPTANVFIENDLKLIAANGVYACKIKINNENFFGMCNIGYRPTVHGKDLTIEANIFNFDRDIYDEYIGVYFVDRIRDEIAFKDLAMLKEQLNKDVLTAKEILGDG